MTGSPMTGSRIVPTPGQGQAHAAIGILNATATGIGCSLAVTGEVHAEWSWTSEPGLRFQGASDDRLARSTLAILQKDLGTSEGAGVRTRATFPPSRGLKTSSGAAAALVQAAYHAKGQLPPQTVLIEQAIRASKAAGVTVTGAYDDQVASVLGGCHLTDNGARQVLCKLPVAPWHVAVWIPEAHISKTLVANLDAAPARSAAVSAARLAQEGDIPGALTQSGAAFTRLYASHKLPVSAAPAEIALEHGALGAGLSGTGPAVVGLFERQVTLPFVPGGVWSWHRAVEAKP